MKTFLFVISLLGFFGASYFLITDLWSGYGLNHLIYLLLLVILLCNSILALILTCPDNLFKKRGRLKPVTVKK
jgi:hypothetical protein